MSKVIHPFPDYTRCVDSAQLKVHENVIFLVTFLAGWNRQPRSPSYAR